MTGDGLKELVVVTTRGVQVRLDTVYISDKGGRQKKKRFFTVRLTVRVSPPPPLRSGSRDFFKTS